MSFFQAVVEHAIQSGRPLPDPVRREMGTILWRSLDEQRAVSLSRRRLNPSEPPSSQLRFWLERPDGPTLCGAFQIAPDEASTQAIADALHEFLVANTPFDQICNSLRSNSRDLVDSVPKPASPADVFYWLGSQKEFGVRIAHQSWEFVSRDRALSTHRSGTAVIKTYSLDVLDAFVAWLRANWTFVVFGADQRPLPIADASQFACRAYGYGRLLSKDSADEQRILDEWRSRHSIREADPDLPNIFIERQGDSLVFSWDSQQSNSFAFAIHEGIEAVPVSHAVPALISLIRRQSPAAHELTDLPSISSSSLADGALGYQVLNQYCHGMNVSVDWLKGLGFTDIEAGAFASTGTSRHPIVGLLRSSRHSTITAADIERIYRDLEKSDFSSYRKLVEFAANLDAEIDPREPWESGYFLARQIRKRMGLDASAYLYIEELLRMLDVVVSLTVFDDECIRGACVGSAGYKPSAIVNTECSDAMGMSGRRTTLAHELCHLLFDRTRMRGFARLESARAGEDRLVEMRANAFAVELLVPMENLFKAHAVLADNELKDLATEFEVSSHALVRHAANLRRRLKAES